MATTNAFIVGDAGGTGTDWRLVIEDEITQIRTIGFNAYTHSMDNLLSDILKQESFKKNNHLPVFFYAAGVETEAQRVDIAEALSGFFSGPIQVENDLLAVARALCGDNEGYVGILGTGSNACHYDGTNVNNVSASLGYILGDEGSGAYLGKKLLAGIYRERFDEHILKEFKKQFAYSSSESIHILYNEPKPNHFLASFAKFVHAHRMSPEMFQLIHHSFQAYYEAFLIDVSHSIPIHFSGSIAWAFGDQLRKVVNEKGLTVQNIVQSPIAGLVLYHQNR